MPQTNTSLSVPDKQAVSVIETQQYGTLWNQFLADTSTAKLLYFLLAPFLLTTAFLSCITRNTVILTTNPNTYPVHLSSTAENTITNPVALTGETQYISHSLGLSRIVLFTKLALAYVRRTPIALQLTHSDDPIVSSDQYIVTEDEDSLRPIVLFR